MRIDGDEADRGFWITLRTTELPTAENPAPLTARYVWGYDPSTDEHAGDTVTVEAERAGRLTNRVVRGW